MLEMALAAVLGLAKTAALAVVLVAAALAAVAVYLWTQAGDEGKQAARAALADTRAYWSCLLFFVRGGAYTECPHLADDMPARARVFGMALAFTLWSKPHYRNGTFQDDMKKNLRNVAVPGTGLPLSVFAYNRALALFFAVLLYPLFAALAGLNVGRRDLKRACDEYREQLLHPTDWFGFWRLNCALASYHASVTKEKAYELEDKLTFLQVAEEKGVAVSPFLDVPALICKHRNEEGGLGCKFFSNAVAGGDWIIQEVLANEEPIKGLLPENAPLSTFRVITISDGADKIVPLSCVWRAGLAGAQTDHQAVLFDVDATKGCFKKGVTNAHWYRLGPDKVVSTAWRVTHDISCHPDNGKQIEGEKIDAKAIMGFAERAHKDMMPKVPIVGWDVALTNKGMLMLECNLSCNFFLGSFDLDAYFAFVDRYFRDLEAQAKTADKASN